MRQLLDTVNRLPLGVFLDTGVGCLIVDAVTADPCPDRPHRLRVAGRDADSLLPDLAWFEPGEIVHYLPAA